MAKKSGKHNDAQVKQLTTKVENLRPRLKKAEAVTAKWKAEAKRLDSETAKLLKQVKKLRKANARSLPDAVEPRTNATTEASTAEPLPYDSWTVTRLRASARDAGVAGYSRMTKAALLEVLTQAAPPRG